MVDGNAPAIRSARREELPGRVAKLPAADRSHPTCPQRCGGDEPGALSSGWRRAGAHLAPPGGGCRDCSRLSPSPADHPRRQAGASAARMSLWAIIRRSEEHTSELQSLMRISYAVFCLKKKKHIYLVR